MDIFYFKKGYLRTTSQEYNLSEKEKLVHLTNNCLQKFGEAYGKHEDGNTLGYEHL